MTISLSPSLKVSLFLSAIVVFAVGCQPKEGSKTIYPGPTHETLNFTAEFNKVVVGTYQGKRAKFEFDGKGSGTAWIPRVVTERDVRYECTIATPFTGLKYESVIDIAQKTSRDNFTYKISSYSVSEATSIPKSSDAEAVCQKTINVERARLQGFDVAFWYANGFSPDYILIDPYMSPATSGYMVKDTYHVKTGKYVDLTESLSKMIGGQWLYAINYNGKVTPQLKFAMDPKNGIFFVAGVMNLGINECLGRLKIRGRIKNITIDDKQSIQLNIDDRGKAAEFTPLDSSLVCPTAMDMKSLNSIELHDFSTKAKENEAPSLRLSIGKLGPYPFRRVD